jgi:PAS domain S-box-containing protein
MLGYTPEEWNDGGWRQRVHPHDAEMVFDATARSTESGEPFNLQYRYLAKDGRIVWVHDRATLAQRNQGGETLLFEGVMIDITEMKEAERKARLAEDRFQEIVEHGPVVLYAFSVEPEEPLHVRLDYLSPQLEDLLGVARSAWQEEPMTWFDMIHPDDRAMVLERSQRNSRTGEGWESAYRMIAADGSIKWLADRGTCVERDADGRPLRFIGVLGDITERREEIAALQSDLELLRPITNEGRAITWSDAYDIETDASRYTYMSPNVTDILGYTPEELLQESENFPRLVHPDDVERVVATFDRLAPTGQWDDTYRVIARDGTVRWLEAHGWRATPPDENPQRWHGVTIDVTHLHTDELTADTASDGAAAEAPN